jgi:hypothetical protein
MSLCWLRPRSLLLFVGLLFCLADAQAVPSFARQTGWDCTKCHMSWLELTNVGRRFKLGGYQEMKAMDDDAKRPLVSFNFEDNPPIIPLAIWVQISRTSTQDVSQQGYTSLAGSAGDPTQDPKQHDGAFNLQAATVFLNGKLYDGIGCFCQYTYDPVAHQASQDNAEIRFVPDEEYKSPGLNVLYGVSLNNNPGMSDIYNTTGVWGWPYLASAVAITPGAGTVLGSASLGHTVAGLSLYSLWNRTFYVEAGAYGNARSILHALTINNTQTKLDGLAPYYRLALQHDWQNGVQSAEIGTYGLQAKISGDQVNGGGPSDKYTDRGIDAQYQYITDEHRFSFMFNYVHETSTLDATFPTGGSANPGNTLNQINTKFSYYYQKWYGISAGYQRVSGTSDALFYPNADTQVANGGSVVNGFANGSPNSQAMIYELDWLFAWDNAEDRRRNRIILQYTDYSKFNGASTNYNGYGRNARDNNTIYIAWWSVY